MRIRNAKRESKSSVRRAWCIQTQEEAYTVRSVLKHVESPKWAAQAGEEELADQAKP